MNTQLAKIPLILLLSAVIWADVSIDVVQDGSDVTVLFSVIDVGAYVEIIGCDESTMMSAIVMADTSFTFAIPPCCSIYVRWTPIRQDTVVNVMPIGDNKVRIPGGWYHIGADDGDVGLLMALGAPSEFIARATPDVYVFVDTFDIMTVEVPCSLYSQFIAVGGYDDSTYWRLFGNELSTMSDTLAGWNAKIAGGWSGDEVLLMCDEGSLPARGVSYYEATACAHWMGGQLPTEAQWEVAARLMTGDIFPWGNEFCIPEYTLTANIADPQQCAPDPFAGGPGYPEFFDGDISSARCQVMGGNLSEWCLDVFTSSYYSAISPLSSVMTGSEVANKTVRGGNFASGDKRDATVFKREPFAPTLRENNIGFRVAWSIGDGQPNDWHIEPFALDCEPPDTLGIWNPNGCLLPTRTDSFAIIFSEPVMGDITTTPDDPINIVYHFNDIPGETLWIIKSGFADIPSGTLCVDLSALTDSAGIPIDSAINICVPLCEQNFLIVQRPETLWAPQECSNQGAVWLINLSDYSITIDSVITYPPFELLGAVDNIDELDSASLTVKLTPDCSGIITVPIVVFTDEGIFSDTLLGLGCDQPAVIAVPTSIDFGEECDIAYIDFILRMAGCSMGSLEICDIAWAKGEVFTLDSIALGDTLVDSLRGSAQFNPTGRGTFYDTLSLRFRPLGGVCCDATTITIPIYAVCKTLPCSTQTDYDAVTQGDVVNFSCVNEKVYIYSYRGRLVKILEPDADGDAKWKLLDENLRPVPSGVYYWRTGKFYGTIIVLK